MADKISKFKGTEKVSLLPLTPEQINKLNNILDDFLVNYRAGKLTEAEEKIEYSKKIFAAMEITELISTGLFSRNDVKEILVEKGVTDEEKFILLQVISFDEAFARESLYAAESEVATNDFKKKLAPFFEKVRKKLANEPNNQRWIRSLYEIEQEIAMCFYTKFRQVFSSNNLEIATKAATEEAYLVATHRSLGDGRSLAARINAISPVFRAQLINFFDTLK